MIKPVKTSNKRDIPVYTGVTGPTSKFSSGRKVIVFGNA